MSVTFTLNPPNVTLPSELNTKYTVLLPVLNPTMPPGVQLPQKLNKNIKTTCTFTVETIKNHFIT